MPFARPSLGDLWNRIGALWRTSFPGADTNLRKTPGRAIVALIARSTDECLSFLDWMVLQLFPFSAAREYLERWASWKGVYRKAATVGAGVAGASAGSGTPGYVAVAGTELQTSNGGTKVVLTSDCTVAGDGSISAQVQAVLAAGDTSGSLTNIGTGVALSFVSTPPGFPDSLTVTVAFAGGADEETDAQLRLRTQRRYQQPSFGGNQNDWQNAALAVVGVTRAFTAPASPTPGAVTIFPLFDQQRGNGIPVGVDAWFRPGTGASAGTGGAGDQLLVLNDVLSNRPVCASVYVKAFVPQALEVTITGLVTLSDAVKAAIAKEIAAMLVNKLPVIEAQGTVIAQGYTIYREWISAAISQASGVKSFDLPVPAADIVVPAGHLLVLDTITYG